VQLELKNKAQAFFEHDLLKYSEQPSIPREWRLWLNSLWQSQWLKLVIVPSKPRQQEGQLFLRQLTLGYDSSTSTNPNSNPKEQWCSSVCIVQYWTRNREVADSTHTLTTPSNLEQVANLLCAQGNSVSYPQWDRKLVATATGWRPGVADWGDGVSASCTMGQIVR